MTRILRRILLATLFFAGFSGALLAGERPRNKMIRLHYPIISVADNIEALRPVAATPNIPVYEDNVGRRSLAGVDFAPFLYAWLESYLARSGFSAQSSALLGVANANVPGLLLELRDLRVNLSAAEVSYAGTLTVMRPTGTPYRHDFNILRGVGDCEEGRLEPHELVSHNFEALLVSLRNHLAEDIARQMVSVDGALAGGTTSAPGGR